MQMEGVIVICRPMYVDKIMAVSYTHLTLPTN